MYLATLAPSEAIGHILRHNISDARGHKAFSKGHRIAGTDLERMLSLRVDSVRVAILESGDVHEDEAARRLAHAIGGTGLSASGGSAGRVNLLADATGVVRIDIEKLFQINDIDGLTVATLANHSLVRAHKRVATIKVIPFAVHEEALANAEILARADRPVVAIHPLRPLLIGVVLVGSMAARERLERGVYPAIEGRAIDLGAPVLPLCYVPPDEDRIAEAINGLCASGAQLIIIAGETSIMDRDDVTPLGIRRAGGRIEHYGAPVEPGNLLLLAYLEESAIPVLGAPGCVRSRNTNIVDLLLPRLLAGEHIRRHDIVVLGHGGLLG